ncbi:MAG TPA: type IV-A pilus assembly ATPase PilB [Candidatus Sumerlaeota bacterium]|nr:type IV-A pilus assembly ATPase PilB [Candidatus Sumerlaeota bacterium]
MERKLGELLVKDNIITREELEEALGKRTESNESLGHILMEMGVASEWEIAAALGKQLNVPFITLSQYEIERDVLESIPRDIVMKYKIVPVDRTGDTLTVALPDPSNIFILDELRLLTKSQIVPVISFETDIEKAIGRYFKAPEEKGMKLEDMMTEMKESDMEILQQEGGEDEEMDLNIQINDAPVIRLVNAIIAEAIRMKASDIHIEPYEKELRLRYRLDGVLMAQSSPSKSWQNAIISRLKILSEMDIAEKRLPQDGRFRVRMDGKDVDFRVNTVPVPHGEKVVIRILDQGNLMLDLTRLGLTLEEIDKFNREINKPWGMCLVTGPTGSGKSTTLYSALSTINTPTINICTAEDPVEYQLPGINQVAVNEKIGLTFATALRAFLRQDPDVIMVGEIRDLETAEISIKAALTGHLVFSTLHTNDASSSISRMVNMGVEPFLVAASLNMIVAQRLVRRVCASCKETYEPTPEQRKAIGIEDPKVVFSRGAGCDICGDRGYKGRVALYEILVNSDRLRDSIIANVPPTHLKREAILQGMTTLRMSGVRKIKDGVTTVEEVLSATVSDSDE